MILCFSFRIDDNNWSSYQLGDICSLSGSLSTKVVAQGSTSSGSLNFYTTSWNRTISNGYVALQLGRQYFSTGIKYQYMIVY